MRRALARARARPPVGERRREDDEYRSFDVSNAPPTSIAAAALRQHRARPRDSTVSDALACLRHFGQRDERRENEWRNAKAGRK